MVKKINLAKKLLSFYLLLAVPICFASLYNLVFGVILKQTESYRIGVFSLFGFILMPTILYVTYKRNVCLLKSDRIIIGKDEYLFVDYDFEIVEKVIPFIHRPIFSLFKKKYNVLVIKCQKTNTVLLTHDLDVFKSDIRTLRASFPKQETY